MLSFEPKRRTRVLFGLAFLPLLAGALFFLGASLRLATLGSRLAAHEERRTDDGPVALRGELSLLEASSTSPLGAPAAGWVAAVGRTSWQGGPFEVLCAVGHFDDVAVRRNDGFAFRLSVARTNERVRIDEEESAKWLFGADPRVGIALGGFSASADGPGRGMKEATGIAIPPVIREACGKELVALGDSAVYRERVLAEGMPVTVFGCKQTNDVVPCRDGLDFVTIHPLDRAKERIGNGGSALLFVGGLFSLVVLSAAGFGVLSLASRTRRSFR
ncbi:hypothetical protein [Polyangium mundeleinium]|uniref:RING-type E3 ubiquitin transferase n=1 Tax=Polyangium mundeleinium TaxID=2995306 RepID=A0ABT5EJQ2_9BACT|nr:hypothetical protein [Polyangium mundeleinium]MDC0742036.1 hypothetical protein [Polyangium mundeleinium]